MAENKKTNNAWTWGNFYGEHENWLNKYQRHKKSKLKV